MGGAVPVLQPRGCPSEHAMDEVLLIHDWQAMPHVVMNLLCCRRSCATTAVDNLRGARGELLQIVNLRAFGP